MLAERVPASTRFVDQLDLDGIDALRALHTGVLTQILARKALREKPRESWAGTFTYIAISGRIPRRCPHSELLGRRRPGEAHGAQPS